MQGWRDGVEFEGFGGEDGWVWRGVVEAFGSGGRDFGRGEYEEVLVEGGDAEDADLRGGVGWGTGGSAQGRRDLARDGKGGYVREGR